MTVCMCRYPIRMATFCGRCYSPIVTVMPAATTTFGGAAPVNEAGAGRPSTPAPATLDDDYTPTWDETEGGRIKAASEKRTGR